MACSNRNDRCRRRRGEASRGTENNTPRRCADTTTIAEDLYGVTIPTTVTQTCCDSASGCQEMNACARCSFWPNFAHPRWLTCSELFNVPVSGQNGNDNDNGCGCGNRRFSANNASLGSDNFGNNGRRNSNDVSGSNNFGNNGRCGRNSVSGSSNNNSRFGNNAFSNNNNIGSNCGSCC